MFPGPSCPATGFFVCASPAPSSWGLSFSCPFFPGLIFRLSGMACRTAAGSCSPVCGGLLSFVPPSVPDAESSYFPYILHSYQAFLFHGPGRESSAAAQRRGPAIPTGAKFFRGWRGYGGGRGSFYKKRPFPSRHYLSLPPGYCRGVLASTGAAMASPAGSSSGMWQCRRFSRASSSWGLV